MMHHSAILVVVLATACGSDPAAPSVDAQGGGPDSAPAIDGASPDAPAGFGELGGMCGALMAAQLTSAQPELFRAQLTFARAYDDAQDRVLLTAGGQRLAATPNAGGSSGLSEIFAYEELARCEEAVLLKTETEIVYTTPGKITDMLVELEGMKLGVSVVRAFAFPIGTPYTAAQAMPLIERKLDDIRAASANVSPGDRWVKQALAVIAIDDQAAQVVADVWAALDAETRADTLVIVTSTNGADTFIYTE